MDTQDLMTKPGKTGLSRLVAATGYSFKGLRAAWRCEEAFRIEACLAIAFLPLSFWLAESLSHQLILIMSCAIVVIAELINSAIEANVDRVSNEMHPLSGQAKDLGSAAVFISLLLFATIWGLSAWHYWR